MLLHSRGQVGERELVNINDLLEDAIPLAYHGARAHNIKCEIKIEKKLNPELKPIYLVPQDLSRVFVNIISNACYAVQDKYRDLGNKYVPTITVSSRDDGDWVEIRVGDNGYGIPENDRSEIFTPFYTTKPAGEGTGLGLSLSYNIVVQGHQGKIEVQSELEKSTEFIIRLPKQ
jgi:signal transduction histidine kinase